MRSPKFPVAVITTVIVVALAIYFDDSGSSNSGGSRPGGSGSQAVDTAVRPDPDELSGVTITRVVDGDTIHVRLRSGEKQKVRLIGIDTPETSTLRNGHTECGGRQAASATQALAARSPAVNLATDPGQDAYDQYDRLLAYVEPADAPATTFQQELLRQGWARVYVFDGDPFQRVKAFRAAADQARAARAGVWSACGGDFRQPLS